MRKWLELLMIVFLCQAVGALGALATVPNLESWYAGLLKPAWTPPGWLFGPAWTVLYVMMAAAFWLVWNRRDHPAASRAMFFFGIQLALNGAWSWCFFALRNPGLGLVDIGLLWGVLVLTTRFFFMVRRSAGLLLVPYVLWVSFAAALNFSIWQLNAK